jgi:hypothetical protein
MSFAKQMPSTGRIAGSGPAPRSGGRTTVAGVLGAGLTAAVGLCVAAILPPAGAAAAGFPPSETFLPATTRVWASAADPQELRRRFERSALGGLVYEPLMSTFLDGLRQQGKASMDPLRGSLEINAMEVAKIAGGEVALAAVERPDGTLATLLLIDTTGQDDAVKGVVDDIVVRVAAKGGKAVPAPAGIRAFAVAPPAKPAVPASQAAGGPPPKSPAPREVVVALGADTLVVGDRLDTVVATLAASGKPPAAAASLAGVPAFVTALDRTGRDVPAAAPKLRWFIDPLAYLAADRRTHPPRATKKSPDYAAILSRHGFDAIKGAGGHVFFGEDGVDLRHNSLIVAPVTVTPGGLGKAARMLCFPNAPSLGPAPWVPAGVASCTALEWDVNGAFAAIPPLVDEVIGEPGVFADVIESLKQDPDGPQIDVDQDLVCHLGKRVLLASDHVAPLGVDCERMLIAIETKNADVVATALAKAIASEGDVRRVEAGSHVIWETVAKPVAAPGGGADDEARRRARGRVGGREREDRDSAWPNLSVSVANGHVLLASHRDFLERVLSGKAGEPLTADERFRAAAAAREKLLPGESALVTFTDTARLVRPAWELLREGRLPESRGLAATMLTRLLEREAPGRAGAAGGPRKQEVDGSSLPAFEDVRKYFGISTLGMQSTPDGWYLAGVGLWHGVAKPGAAAPAAAR